MRTEQNLRAGTVFYIIVSPIKMRCFRPKPSEDDKKNGGVDKKLLHVMEEYLETLRERSRRMILRKIKAGNFIKIFISLFNIFKKNCSHGRMDNLYIRQMGNH